MSSAAHALGHRRKTLLKAGKVDKSGHESWYLNRRSVDKRLDKLLDGRKGGLLRVE